MNRLTLALIVGAAIPVVAIAQTTTPPADPSTQTNTTAPVDTTASNSVDPASNATAPDATTNTTAPADPVTKKKKKPAKPEEPRP